MLGSGARHAVAGAVWDFTIPVELFEFDRKAHIVG